MLFRFSDLLFLNNDIVGIIHIGAHKLEELPEYLNHKLDRIIWVEANPDKYKYIENKIKNYDQMLLAKFAAGFKEEEKSLNIANNGESSSMLKFGTHEISYPHIFYTSKVKVNIKPFDGWMDEKKLKRNNFNFLNIDIQGYELEALKGMTKQLKILDYIYIEVNFSEVYQGSPNIYDIDNFLLDFGFQRVGTIKTKYGWGDAIYAKEKISLLRIYYKYLKIIMLKRFIFYKFKKIFKIIKKVIFS